MSTETSHRVLEQEDTPVGAESLPSKEMRSLVADLFDPRPVVFWADFLLSMIIGWAAFTGALLLEPFSAANIGLILVSCFALYRGLAFIHELTHLKPRALPGFRAVWNLICGLPLLLPDFTYMRLHLVHHSKRDFGTQRDPEYTPFGRRSKAFLLKHFPVLLLLPLAQIVRFGVFAPLSLFDRGLRRKVREEMSAIALKFPYRRDLPVHAQDWTWWNAEEFGCAALVLGGLMGILAGLLPLELAIQWYVVMVIINVLNFIRTMGATHLYATDMTTVSFEEQFLDSVNVESSSLMALLICPVGLRFHALHHLFPAIPYHNLGIAHRRIVEHYSGTSIYTKATVPSLWAGCAQLWHAAGWREERQGQGSSRATT